MADKKKPVVLTAPRDLGKVGSKKTTSVARGVSPGGSSGKKAKTAGEVAAKDPYAEAQRKQDAKERKAKRASSDRSKKQADRLEDQAKALRLALGKTGFRRALNRKLSDVDQAQAQGDQLLMEGWRRRLGVLKETRDDNTAAATDTMFESALNRGREGGNALSEIALQGAGESDALLSLNASLRNWAAQAQDVSRSYNDTLTSINASLEDLNVDTKTARANNMVEANGDKAQLWTSYFNQRGEAYTNLGNTLAQQADYLDSANEQRSEKKVRKEGKAVAAASEKAFKDAARMTGKSWDNPGLSQNITGWQGERAFEPVSLGAPASAGRAQRKMTGPEGATLRKWE